MSNVLKATAGTTMICIKDHIEFNVIRIYKGQIVKKINNFASGKIAVEVLYNGRLAIVDPQNFDVAELKNQHEKKARDWKIESIN